MEKNISISKMAEIHNISRQTLIYYDKLELFKPIYTDENGYRYYNPYQIPFLREICFLKSIGVKLQDIKKHIENRNLSSAISLLECHKDFIDKEIQDLIKTKEFIEQRLDRYENINYSTDELNTPSIEEFDERKVIFVPFENEICKKELHFTTLKTWDIITKHGMVPSNGFGTMIMKSELEKDNIFLGAGVYLSVPTKDYGIENVITLPAGKYACMYKYGMPYETDFLYKLIEWIKDNNYRIIGNVVDACLLDTTFYKQDVNVDFCKLEIPVEKII